MFCTKCGNELSVNDLFCPECGTKSTNISEQKHLGSQENYQADFNMQSDSFEYSEIDNRSIKYSLRQGKPVLVKTMIVGNDSRKSATSSVIRGTVGGLILGPIGLVGGLLSGKNRNKTTFLLLYSDGSKQTLTVKTGGLLFNKLIKFMSE